MEFAFVASWILCCILASRIAYARGGEATLYGIAGLLLGPAGVLLALVSGRYPDVLDRRAVASGRRKVCPFCRELARVDAIRCPHCLEELPPTATRA